MEFGIPKKHVKKEEKYKNIGVITLKAVEKEGGSRRIEFNKKALELLNIELGLNSKFSLSFSNGEIYIVNTSTTNVAGLTLGKVTPAVSNKKYYDYIRKTINGLDDDNSVDLELFLVETERTYMEEKVYVLKKIENMTEEDILESINPTTEADTEMEKSE